MHLSWLDRQSKEKAILSKQSFVEKGWLHQLFIEALAKVGVRKAKQATTRESSFGAGLLSLVDGVIFVFFRYFSDDFNF